MERRGRHAKRSPGAPTARAWLVAAALLAATVWATPARALQVRIRARSDVDISVTAAGTMVHVSGVLHDELNHALPQRKVHVFFVEQGASHSSSQQISKVVFSDRRGAFSVHRELAPGRWKVSVRFDETEHVAASSAQQMIEVEPSPVDLRIQVPRLVVGAVDDVPVRVRASANGVGLQDRAHVLVNGSDAADVELDQFGRATCNVAANLRQGYNAISVEVPATKYRKRQTTKARLRVSQSLAVDAHLRQGVEKLERGLVVAGEISDQLGAVPGVRVSVRIHRKGDDLAKAPQQSSLPSPRGDARAPYERFVTTNRSGHFEAFFAADKLADGVWQADVDVVPEVGAEVSVPTESVELDRTTSRWLLDALGLLALLGGLGLIVQRSWAIIGAYLSKRRRQADSRQRAEEAFRDTETLTPQAMSADGPPVDPSPAPTRVSGLVWDVWKSRPVEGAEITVSTPAGDPVVTETSARGLQARAGSFVVDGLAPGRYKLTIRAHGFMPGSLEFRLPHGGRLGNVRLDLVAVPLKIRRLYQSLVETLEGEDLWGRLSPRQIEAALGDALHAHGAGQGGRDLGTPGRRAFIASLRRQLGDESATLSGEELVSMMTAVVEETYFSGRVFDETVWELARDIAMRLREQAASAQEAR